MALGHATAARKKGPPLERATQAAALVGSPVWIVPELPTATQSVALGQATSRRLLAVPLLPAVQDSAAGTCASTPTGPLPTAATPMTSPTSIQSAAHTVVAVASQYAAR